MVIYVLCWKTELPDNDPTPKQSGLWEKICYQLDINYALTVHHNGIEYNAKLCTISMKIDYNKTEIKQDTP